MSTLFALVSLALFTTGAGGTGDGLVLDGGSVVSRAERSSRLEVASYSEWKRAFDQDRPLEVSDVRLEDGRRIRLTLRPIHVLERGGVVQVMGERGAQLLEPTLTLFRGEVVGEAGEALFAMTPSWMQGRVVLDGKTHAFQAGQRTSPPTAARPILPNQPGDFCRVVPNPSTSSSSTGSSSVSTRKRPVPSSLPSTAPDRIRVLDVIVDCDLAFRSIFASDVEAANYALLLYAAKNEIYRRDLGVLLRIPSGNLRVWNVAAPWEPSAGGLDLYYKYSAWWRSPANPEAGKARAFCHLLSSSLFFVGGVAGFSGLCSPTTGVAVSACNGHFPFPLEHTSPDNWDLYVSAHEVGHVLGSLHTFDYRPKIKCNDGTGPDEGTLMSYCYQRPSGVSAIGLRFHERVQGIIRARTFQKKCPSELVVPRGDYDLDGLHRPSDLAAFDGYLSQGFFSSGAQETFDLDGNGSVDALDRDILVDLVSASTATLTSRNGSGVNPVKFTGLGTPKLGRIWTGQIKDVYKGTPASLPPFPVGLILGYARPAAGSFVPQGEVLVDPSSVLYFAHAAPMNWIPGYSLHAIHIPGNSALAGQVIYAQGVIFSQDTQVYATNALDLHLGY